MNTSKHPIIIPAVFGSAEIQQFALPAADQNLFGRIIRNPHAADRRPRERECTEMLCAVLLNTEQLRNAILDWLGGSVGQSPDWENLDLSFATEQSILGKRDDLRITGSHSEQSNDPVLLWSVEVKVGSGFHYSGAVEPESDEAPMNQISEYDRWLAQQNVENLAGFVLSVRDMTFAKPSGLRLSWPCLTWTELGTVVERLLAGNTLSAIEAFLARHLLGFIRNNLWEASMATSDINTRLDFDDIALLRAFELIGNRTIARMDSLIDPLAAVLTTADLGGGRPIISSKIFQGNNRKVVYQSLLDVDNSKPPYLMVGLVSENGFHLTVSIEASPNYVRKPALNRMFLDRLAVLHERNLAWRVFSLGDRSWRDLELAASVEQLLVAEDQVAWMKDFVVNALDDLKVTGVIEEIRRIALGTE